jgi:hypothetical protein
MALWVKLSLCLIKGNAMKTDGRVDVKIQKGTLGKVVNMLSEGQHHKDMGE